MAITFGPKGFRKHLEALPPHTIVGHAGKVNSCPLARYGTAQGAMHCSVSSEYIAFSTNATKAGTSLKHPPWRRSFVIQVDHNKPIGDPITREEALYALDVAEGKAYT